MGGTLPARSPLVQPMAERLQGGQGFAAAACAQSGENGNFVKELPNP